MLANAETLNDFLFTPGVAPSMLSKTISLAEKEKDRIQGLMNEFSGAALFLPVDSAWSGKPKALTALLAEPEGNVRYDMLLASAAALPPTIGHTYEALKEYASEQGGVVDSAYGTSYFVNGERQLCLAEWAAGNYLEGDCANLIGDPILLSDATVFMVDRLLISSDLEDGLESLFARRL